MEIVEITGTEEFYNEIRSEIFVMADFYAKWCSPCKMQSPVLFDFAKSAEGKVKIIKVDVDANAEIADRYKIESIPTLVLFENGNEKERKIGLTTRPELSDMLIKYLK